jgi:hypothetical protein
MAQWEKLFSLPVLVQQYKKGAGSAAVAIEAKKIIAQWRSRLMDISWYMRSLNEHLARRANEEDRCTGRFWEGRYKSQALLDEAAVLTCMSYVDLNPIRAGISDTPEDSGFTSIQQRINQWQQSQTKKPNNKAKSTAAQHLTPVPLMRLVRQSQDPHRNAVGYSTKDYLELVDWAGRAMRDDKRGAIETSIPPILERLNLNPETYLSFVGTSSSHRPGRIRQSYNKALGSVEHLKTLAAQLGQKFICGLGDARRLYVVNS